MPALCNTENPILDLLKHRDFNEYLEKKKSTFLKNSIMLSKNIYFYSLALEITK